MFFVCVFCLFRRYSITLKSSFRTFDTKGCENVFCFDAVVGPLCGLFFLFFSLGCIVFRARSCAVQVFLALFFGLLRGLERVPRDNLRHHANSSSAILFFFSAMTMTSCTDCILTWTRQITFFIFISTPGVKAHSRDRRRPRRLDGWRARGRWEVSALNLNLYTPIVIFASGSTQRPAE